ncbi:MAG: transposase [Anaerolineae bacterium]
MDASHRRSLRLADFDYADERAYFVTICVRDRNPVLGEVQHENVYLSTIGEITRDCWLAIPAHSSFVELDSFVIMPDHMHGIIFINHQAVDVGARHALPLQTQQAHAIFGKPQPGSLGVIVGSFKSAVTKRANDRRGTPGVPLWQRNYYDHIIRAEDDLNAIRAYIDTNPARWEEVADLALDHPVWNRHS